MREVGAAGFFQQLARARRHDGEKQALHFFGADGFHFHLADGIPEPHHGRQADFQVKVGALVLHDHAEEFVRFGLTANFRWRLGVQGNGFHVCYSHSNLRSFI